MKNNCYILPIQALKKFIGSWWGRVGKKPRKFQKTHGNGKNWFLPGKMGKTGKTVFFEINV
jgi:hypothetical protein